MHPDFALFEELEAQVSAAIAARTPEAWLAAWEEVARVARERACVAMVAARRLPFHRPESVRIDSVKSIDALCPILNELAWCTGVEIDRPAHEAPAAMTASERAALHELRALTAEWNSIRETPWLSFGFSRTVYEERLAGAHAALWSRLSELFPTEPFLVVAVALRTRGTPDSALPELRALLSPLREESAGLRVTVC